MSVLLPVASASGPLVPVAVALALVELTLLIVLSPRYRIGVLGALAAMLGNAAITTLVPILLIYVALAASGCNECLS